MADFGFTIKKARTVNLDKTNMDKFSQLIEAVPSFKRCIGCGGCTSSCSARQFIDFNIRKTHNQFRRGQYDQLEEALQKCMLCGKCTLVCPRGVNLRSLIINMRQILSNTTEILG